MDRAVLGVPTLPCLTQAQLVLSGLLGCSPAVSGFLPVLAQWPLRIPGRQIGLGVTQRC